MTEKDKQEYAFVPDSPGDMAESELLALVSARVKEAFKKTRKTRLRLDKTLAALQTGITKNRGNQCLKS